MANSALDQALTQFRSNLSNTVSDVGKNITQITSPVANFVKQATTTVNGVISNPGNQTKTKSLNYKVNNLQEKQSPIIQNFVKSAQQGIQDWTKNPIKNTINLVKDAPTNIARYNLNTQKSRMKPVTSQQLDIQDKKEEEMYNKMFSPIDRSETNDSIYMPWAQDAKYHESSAQLAQQPDAYVSNPESDPVLEKFKQKVLSNPNITEATRAYLSDIPISYRGSEEKFSGMSEAPGTPNRQIIINEKLKDQPREVVREDSVKQQSVKIPDTQLEEVIQHELLHQAPRLLSTKEYKPINQKKVEGYIQRWGKDYMKARSADVNRGGALAGVVEEMFAEKDLPSAYYWHIFKNVVPNATPQNFIDTIKSVFAEPDRFNYDNKPYLQDYLNSNQQNGIQPTR